MAILKRVIAGLAGIVLLALAMLVPAMPWRLAQLAYDIATALQTAPAMSLFWAGVTLAALGVLLLLLALSQPRQRYFEAEIEGAVVQYPPGTVREEAERELLSLPEVRRARVHLSERTDAVDLLALVDTEPSFDLQRLAVPAASRVRDRLEHGLGLRVEQLRVTVRPVHGSRWAFWRRHDAASQPARHDYSSTT